MSGAKRAAEPDETPRKVMALPAEPTYREVMNRLHPSSDLLVARTDRMGMLGFLHDDVLVKVCERLSFGDLVAHGSVLGEAATVVRGSRALDLFYAHPDELTAILIRLSRAQRRDRIKLIVAHIPPLRDPDAPRDARISIAQYACHKMWTALCDHSAQPKLEGNEFLATYGLPIIRVAMLVSCTHPMRTLAITKICRTLTFAHNADYDVADMLTLFGELDNTAACKALVRTNSCETLATAALYAIAAREHHGEPLQLDQVATMIPVSNRTRRDEISRMLEAKEARFVTADAFNVYLCRLMQEPWCDAILALWRSHTHELSEDSLLVTFFERASERTFGHFDMFKEIASDPRAANLVARTNIPELAVANELPSILRFALSGLRKWSDEELCRAYRAIGRRRSGCAKVLAEFGRPSSSSGHGSVWISRKTPPTKGQK